MRLTWRRPDLSIIVVAFEMDRELPRTLMSLSRRHQRGVDHLDYDVLVVDNGSPTPVSPQLVSTFGQQFRVARMPGATPSPVAAANWGVRHTAGHNVAVVLDGARMVTPGVISTGMYGLGLTARSVVSPMAWHLGPEHQSVSVTKGYSSATEDQLLSSVDWPTDGYRLFDICSLAGSNPGGMLGDLNESCFLMLARQVWKQVGGYDERFDLPGGGLANLDLFTRLVELRNAQPVVLLGEGSFHQLHHGESTSPGTRFEAWAKQYEQLRGHPYARPVLDPLYLGRLSPQARRWIARPPSDKPEKAGNAHQGQRLGN